MAAWDEDDHLLDEMLDDDEGVDAGGFAADGWDEDLTGLSSDEEPALAPETAATTSATAPTTTAVLSEKADAAVGSAAGAGVKIAPAPADLAAPVASSSGEEADNAWDFDDFDDDIADNIPAVDSSVPETQTANAQVDSLRGRDLSVEEPVRHTEEQQKVQSVVVSDESNNNQTSQNGGDEWDFEDDLFSEQSGETNEEQAVATTETQVGKDVSRPPPPPPPPPALPNPFLASQPAPAAQPTNPFLAEPQPTVRQAQQTNPFLNGNESLKQSAPAQSEPTNQATVEATGNDEFADDNDGWSDDEAFFDDDAMETLPVVPSKLPKSSVPPPPPPQHHMHQQPLTDPTQIKIHTLLQSYLKNTSSSQFLPRLHAKMHTDSNLHAQGANLREYYATRPGLRQYTLGVEMDRMDYMLVTHDGRRLADKESIRQYFGTQTTEEEPTMDEVLIRSANQSLLADALVLLTGSEDMLLNDEFFNNEDMNLILSGPLLCMTSVAETCRFVVDLMNGVVEATCFLAIGVPFHGVESGGDEQIVKDGRLVLARARVLVRFRPGSPEMGEESTVQYVVESVESSFSNPDTPLLRDAVISLARDQHDPFSQQEEIQEDVTDVRDLFLLNHHLLSDSHLIAVSDHLVRLKGAAEASSTGFRSALRQLDGVTGVSGKINMIKNATGGGSTGGGIGGFLSLPSAQEIEAAEREAAGSVPYNTGAIGHFPRPNEITNPAAGHFPRPNENAGYAQLHGQGRPPPPPPPPPQTTSQEDRPRPLIGGMFLSGLSRLAAAATQPTDPHLHHEQQPSQAENQAPALYRTGDYANISHNVPHWDGTSNATELTPSAPDAIHRGTASFSSPTQPRTERTDIITNEEMRKNVRDTLPAEAKVSELANDLDGGWSDDGLDFEDECQQEDAHGGLTEKDIASDFIDSAAHVVDDYITPPEPISVTDEMIDTDLKIDAGKEILSPCYPAKSKRHSKLAATFEEECVIVLNEKIEEEETEMKQINRMRRWRPMSEDPIRRQRLMEVMVNQLDGS